MEIITKSGLSKISKEIEERTSGQKTLENLKVQIKIVDHFSDNRIEEILPSNSAAYFEEGEEIQVKELLLDMEHVFQLAIIVHEIGELYVSKNKIPKLKNKFGISIPKDILVDRFVCEWGFQKEIQKARSRENDYGKVYSEALMSWNDPKEYINKMTNWYYSYLSKSV
jgi:hypothetical protein